MSIKLTWLGCAAYILNLDGVNLLFDPFFFRQTNVKANPVLKTKREETRDIAATFISHGHIDHITDAGWFAEYRDVPVYCSKIAKDNIIKWANGEIVPSEAYSLTEKGINNINVVKWGDIIKITEDISVEIIKARHIRFDFNTIFARIKSKEFWKEIKNIKPFSKLLAGDVLSFCINFKGKKIISYGSLCHKYPEILKKDENCEIFITPIAGNSKNHLAKKAGIMIGLLKPKIVVPLHWDDFYPPISRVEDLKPFLTLIEKQFSKIRLQMPKIDEEIELNQ